MELFIIDGKPVMGQLIAYPAGACLVIRDRSMDEKLILKMDDDGFGKLTKFLASHLTDDAMEETKLHGFRVTMSADRVLRVEGSIISEVGGKFKGDIYLPIGDQLEDLVKIMVEMEGDGHILWSTDEGAVQLRLALSHKRGLELNVAVDGQEGNSLRLVFIPEAFFYSLANLKLLNMTFAASFELSNPWYDTQIVMTPVNGDVELGIFGHLADGKEMTINAKVEQLDALQKAMQSYFWG